MKKFIYLLAFTVLLGFSCSSDPVGTASACADLPSLAKAYSDAETAYSASATTANCNAYKNAGNKYLDALKKCSTSSQTIITSTQATIDNLSC
jgi:hypothetical protein